MILIFNDIAGSEILLILVFILIFFGSKSIPTLARTFGRTIRQIKDASSDIQSEIKKSGLDIKKDLNLKGIIEDTAKDIRKPLDQMAVDIDSTMKYEPRRTPKVPKIEKKEEVKPVNNENESTDAKSED
ncbi:MAG: twin-arginine translocase TatA/TatE family subunit [Fluviicola sp.]|nr:twin-arginine translocase TatA/TatE family subunit [Fluviicola sp.]